jgi:hypothetical protein
MTMMQHIGPKLKLLKPETNGLINGKQSLRDGGRIFDRLPSLNYKVTSVTANGDRVFMEYIRTTDNEGDACR